MAHTYFHCGLVGKLLGMAGPYIWPKFTKFVVAFDLPASIGEHEKKRLNRKMMRRCERMAEYASDVLGGEVHDAQEFDGGYRGIGVGDIDATAVIPAHQVASDFLMTYAFESDGITHAEASALDTWLNIQRNEAYLDVYAVTGGEIHQQY